MRDECVRGDSVEDGCPVHSGRVPIWLSLGFSGWFFQNKVSEMGSRPWTCMAQIPFQRGLGVEARRVVMVRTEVAK